jgi:hypothetical protein
MAQQTITTAREECNKYDLTVDPISNRPIVRIGVGSLLLVVSHIFAVPVLLLWLALEKK